MTLYDYFYEKINKNNGFISKEICEEMVKNDFYLFSQKRKERENKKFLTSINFYLTLTNYTVDEIKKSLLLKRLFVSKDYYYHTSVNSENMKIRITNSNHLLAVLFIVEKASPNYLIKQFDLTLLNDEDFFCFLSTFLDRDIYNINHFGFTDILISRPQVYSRVIENYNVFDLLRYVPFELRTEELCLSALSELQNLG